MVCKTHVYTHAHTQTHINMPWELTLVSVNRIIPEKIELEDLT